jgi:hypothetical protein
MRTQNRKENKSWFHKGKKADTHSFRELQNRISSFCYHANNNTVFKTNHFFKSPRSLQTGARCKKQGPQIPLRNKELSEEPIFFHELTINPTNNTTKFPCQIEKSHQKLAKNLQTRK